MDLINRLIPLPEFSKVSICDLYRFWAKVKISNSNHPQLGTPCHYWIGAKCGVENSVRGNFKLNGKNYQAHRVAWFFHSKEDPGEIFVLHHCDYSLCVNWEHLYLGTQQQNVEDAFLRGRRTNKGVFHPRSIFTEDQVKMIRASNELPSQLARQLGVKQTNIYDVQQWRTYKDL